MPNPKKVHLGVAHWILQYLKGTSRKGVLFKRGNELTSKAYTYLDYVELVDDRKSTSSYCTFLRGNLVIWRSMKKMQTLSSKLWH